MAKIQSFCKSAHSVVLYAALLGVLMPAALWAQPQGGSFQQGSSRSAAGGQQSIGMFPGAGAAPGGGANADFDSLIDLIISTIEPTTWEDNGGPGSIRPFPTGVLVDAAGTLRIADAMTRKLDGAASLAAAAVPPPSAASDDPRHASSLRFVSLPRLEREMIRRRAEGEPMEQAMLTLAGLQRVQYVIVSPESGDLILAGPASDWRVDGNGRIVSTETGAPVVRLDDLIALLRRGPTAGDSIFGCAINPRQESLAAAQRFLQESSRQPLDPRFSRRWVQQLRDSVGVQDIEFFGIEPTSHLALVLIEADYHMKLIGMGLADSVPGVRSYLATVRAGEASPVSVLRWWFAMKYDALRSSPDGNIHEIVGQGVRVMSENELLTQQGQRVHTGQSDELNRRFAESFTTHFAALAQKYPVYAELRNVFDLALAVALFEQEELREKAGWQSTLLIDNDMLRMPQWPVPRQVETVVNHRIIGGRTLVAGVSGGVSASPVKMLDSIATSSDQSYDVLASRADVPLENASRVWWWDAPRE